MPPYRSAGFQACHASTEHRFDTNVGKTGYALATVLNDLPGEYKRVHEAEEKGKRPDIHEQYRTLTWGPAVSPH
jgi:hypothetical protein